MKKIGLLLAVCALGAIGLIVVMQYYHPTTNDSASEKTGRIKVHLPEAAKKGQREEGAAPLDDEIAASLDARLLSDTDQAVYDVELSKMKETIQRLNKDFKDVEFKEVPEDFRLKMQPAEDYEAHGRLVHYSTDEADNILVEAGIQDYGECTSTVAYDAEEAFKQSLQFHQPMQRYFGSGKTSGTAYEAQTYLWKDTGAWEPPSGVERYLSIWPAKLDLFASRKLSKGEQVSTVLEGLYEATYEVLGSAEIEGHKTVVFEQRIPDCPMHEALGVPPFKREVSRRFYLDIETSMPLRAEGRVVSYFTDEHRNNPKLPDIPESGIQQNVWVYQVDL